ncbi:MAG: outer membrane beta-barrel protein [Panacagrimonas sp.]
MKTKSAGSFGSAGVALTLMALPMSAQALLEFTPYVSAQVEHDDNVFRDKDGDEAQAVRGDSQRDDTRMRYRGGFTSNFTAGLQKLKLEASGSKFEYDHFKELDHKEHDALGSLDWQIGSLLKGTLEARDRRELQGFETRADTNDRSMRDQTDASLVTKLRVFNDWEIRPRGRIARARYSLDTTENQDLDEDEAALALSYLGRAALTVGVEAVATQGDFIRRDPGDGIIEEYDQWTYQLVGSWTPSPVASMDFSLGASDRNNKGDNVSDDKEVVGSLLLKRGISEKTTLYGGVSRGIYSAQEEGESSVVATSVNLGAYWAATPYLTLNTYAYYSLEDFQDSVIGGADEENREDEVISAQLSLIWAPRPWINVTPHVGFSDRTSDVEAEEYDAFQTGLELKLLWPMK